MKKTFTIRSGNDASDIQTEGSVFDLLSHIPYLMHHHYVLPKIVVNSILRTGIWDSGMSGGCEWTPFELNEEDYIELLKEFEIHGYSYIETPTWVVDRRIWQIYIFEIKHGIPHEQHLVIDQKIRTLEQSLKLATEHHDEAEQAKLMVELMHASDELNDLFDQYIDTRHIP